MLLYTFAYTPLKRVGPVAVFVGAIPGALPPLLGWIAFSGTITYESLIIFGILGIVFFMSGIGLVRTTKDES